MTTSRVRCWCASISRSVCVRVCVWSISVNSPWSVPQQSIENIMLCVYPSCPRETAAEWSHRGVTEGTQGTVNMETDMFVHRMNSESPSLNLYMKFIMTSAPERGSVRSNETTLRLLLLWTRLWAVKHQTLSSGRFFSLPESQIKISPDCMWMNNKII